MPHLDCTALTTDADGLDFLAQVLDVPAEFVMPRKAFEVPAARTTALEPGIGIAQCRSFRAEAVREPA